jgi:hypothetical protein
MKQLKLETLIRKKIHERKAIIQKDYKGNIIDTLKIS